MKNSTIRYITLGIALFSLVVSFCSSIVTYRAQYSERLSVDVAPSKVDYIHAVSVHCEKFDKLSISRAAIWKRITIRNNSNKSLSVVSLHYTEDDHTTYPAVIQPFFLQLWYEENRVVCNLPLELPIFLESGEVISFYALFPFTVSKVLGPHLWELMWTGRALEGTFLQYVMIFSGSFSNLVGFFDYVQAEAPEFVWKLWEKEGATIDSLKSYELDFTRILFEPYQDTYRFIDETNSAPDGFRYKRGRRLFSELTLPIHGYALWNPDPYYHEFDEYRIHLQTNSGRNYSTKIRADAFPFECYVAEIMKSIEIYEE